MVFSISTCTLVLIIICAQLLGLGWFCNGCLKWYVHWEDDGIDCAEVFGLNIADPPQPDSGVEFETSWPVQCKKVIHVKMNEKEMSTSIPVTINGLNLNFFYVQICGK